MRSLLKKRKIRNSNSEIRDKSEYQIPKLKPDFENLNFEFV